MKFGRARSLERKSYWNRHASFSPNGISALILQNLNVDVCIVGAGVTGLSVAYQLLRSGVKKVVVIEARGIASGESSRSTAHLTSVLDERYFKLAHVHGKAFTRLIAKSHADAIEFIASTISENEIDCGFERVDGYVLESGRASRAELEHERDFMEKSGLNSVSLLDSFLAKGTQGFDERACLKFENQAQLDPVRYVSGLTKAVMKLGGKIFCDTTVTEVHGGTPGHLLTHRGHRVTADAIVIAGDSPIANRVSLVHKVAAYRTYAIAGRVPRGSVDPGLYWDTEHPYHYVRLGKTAEENSPHDILIVGGEDHRTGQPHSEDDYFIKLEAWAEAHFHPMSLVEHRWSGQIMEPIDGIAYIGKQTTYGNGVFGATGFSGNGITYSAISGLLLSELVQGRKHPWAEIYDPERIRIAATVTNIRENVKSALPYKDLLTTGEVQGFSEIPFGEGRIIREGGSKIAVYRDDDGQFYALNAGCTHLGGIVRWNDIEKTWDCPCHGSRFDYKGKVLHGPATHDLKPVDDTSEHVLIPSIPNPTSLNARANGSIVQKRNTP